MKFHRTWFADMDDEGTVFGYVPAINLFLTTGDEEQIRELFLIDVGAEVSMASRRLCEVLGIPWEDGTPMILKGISPLEECQVMGRVHDVEIRIPELDHSLVIPICFAAGDAPSLLGRRVFLDAFRIEFDQPFRTTTFEYLLEP